MRSRLFSLLLIFVSGHLLACTGEQFDDTSIHSRKEQVENGLLPSYYFAGSEPERFSIHERMEYYNVPGVSIAVINNGEVEWQGGYGVVENGTNAIITDSTMFQAASISKPVAAIAALMLVEAGLLKLDDDVNDYLASWEIPQNRNTNNNHVSLKRLLNHTAGLTVHGFPGYAVDDEIPDIPEVLNGEYPANTGSVYNDVEPGTMWRYSGGGYTVLQQIIDDVVDRPFTQFVQEEILNDIDMRFSTFEQPLSEQNAKHAASGHLADGTVVDGKWHVYPELAAAGLWTTPSDLAKLAVVIQRSFNGEDNSLLSAEMTQIMLTPNGNNWGLGFTIGGSRHDPFFSHGGANHGFRAQFVAYANSGRGVVIMTNSDNGGDLIGEILRAVSDVYNWPDFKPQPLIVD